MTDFWFWVRLRIFVLTHITFPFLSRKHHSDMANLLAERIRQLTHDKIDFVHDEAEAQLKSIVDGTLSLDDSADNFIALAGDDTDQMEIANALVDLADIFDDAQMDAEKRQKLDSVVDRLLKNGTDDQKGAAKTLFGATLNYGLNAKAANVYFDTLLSEDPNGGE